MSNPTLMKTIDYATLNNDYTVGYNDVIDQVKIAPKGKYTHSLREFVGSIKIDRDPLEIQKEMRNEWN